MAQPAAVQIRRWFTLLAVLLVAVNGAALAGSWLISRSVQAVVDRAEPLASATAAMRQEILAAQRELFRYLAEFADDTSLALAHLDRLSAHLEEARQAAAEDRGEELASIETSAQRYRKVLELMPKTVEGSRDWSRLQEYSATAVALGGAVEEAATRLAKAAQAEIRQRSRNSVMVASGAMWASVAVLAVSLFAVVAFQRWWSRFQDVILEL